MKFLVVDDDPVSRRLLRQVLTSVVPNCTIEDAANGEETMTALEQPDHGYDVIFLDIELGRGDGFDLIAALERPPIVVFVTAYAEYAVEAFAVDAADYLLKPVEPERLADSLGRVARKLARKPEEITLLDVYHAVKPHTLFSLHHTPPNPRCPIGCGIGPVLEDVYANVQNGLEQELARTTIADILRNTLAATSDLSRKGNDLLPTVK